MPNKFTRGPWTFDEHGGTWYVWGPHGAMVADGADDEPVARMRGVGRGATPGEQRANARLIAHAPELLATLEALLEADPGTEGASYWNQRVREAELVCAAARGEGEPREEER